MRYTKALMAASAATVSADCAITAFEENGNWFCQAVSHIKYTGLDIAGSYQAVSLMDESGTCDFETQSYSGSIAPFDEELSVHIRGPTKLKTFAVYTPKSSSTKKRDAQKPKSHAKRHGHQHLHKKQSEKEKRDGDMVIATIDGQIVSWVNDYTGEAATTTTAAAAAATFVKSGKTTTAAAAAASSSSSSSSSDNTTVADGDYERIGYYEASSGTADGITFLGNYGGQGSGVWDTTWGNSLSYLNAAGTGGAESPTVLDDVLVGDDVEYSIWSDSACDEGDTSCGYYRTGTVAQHGFAGSSKVFLFEFQMPLSGETGFNADMPAIWLLNAKIPRTMQYGDCSCWGSDDTSTGGCGEFDVYEVLASGDTKCKSTFHYTNSIGDSNYFDRPTDDYVKVAVVFNAASSTASIKVLDNSTTFSSSLTSAQVEEMIDDQDDLGLSSLTAILS